MRAKLTFQSSWCKALKTRVSPFTSAFKSCYSTVFGTYIDNFTEEDGESRHGDTQSCSEETAHQDVAHFGFIELEDFTVAWRYHLFLRHLLLLWFLILRNKNKIIIINNSSFLYALFPWGPKRLQCIVTPVIGYISMPHLYSAPFPLPREHSLPGIAAYNGAGKFKHNNLSPPTGSPFIHLGREQQCG